MMVFTWFAYFKKQKRCIKKFSQMIINKKRFSQIIINEKRFSQIRRVQ